MAAIQTRLDRSIDKRISELQESRPEIDCGRMESFQEPGATIHHASVDQLKISHPTSVDGRLEQVYRRLGQLEGTVPGVSNQCGGSVGRQVESVGGSDAPGRPRATISEPSLNATEPNERQHLTAIIARLIKVYIPILRPIKHIDTVFACYQG